MSENNTPRVFTEDEHLAVLADRVSKETAALIARVAELETANTELSGKLDVTAVAQAAAEKAAADVQATFDAFKTDLEAERAADARKTERLSALEGLTLPEGFLKDEARVTRIVGMDEDAYNGWLADIKESAAAITPVKTDGLPKETAMHGTKVTPPTVGNNDGKAPAAAAFMFPNLNVTA